MSATVAVPIALPTSSGLLGPVSSFVDVAYLTVAETGGTNPKTVVLRSGSSSGTVLAALTVAAGAGATVTFNYPARAGAQLYAVISGTGTLAGSVGIL